MNSRLSTNDELPAGQALILKRPGNFNSSLDIMLKDCLLHLVKGLFGFFSRFADAIDDIWIQLPRIRDKPLLAVY